MHYRIELIYAAWRWIREWVKSLVLRPGPVPLVTIPTDRHTLFEQLAALRARRASEAAQAQHDIDNLTARWRAAQMIADEAQRELRDIQRANFNASLTASAAEDRLLRQIQEKSSMSLELFIEEMDAELSVLQRTEATVLPSAHRDYVIGKKTLGLQTDAISRKRRAAALHAARARAMAMQVEPLTIEQMNTELIRLRKSIPAIEHETLFNERASIVA